MAIEAGVGVVRALVEVHVRPHAVGVVALDAVQVAHCPVGPETAVLSCQAPRVPIQTRHAEPIYCGKREGRLTAPGGSGR